MVFYVVETNGVGDLVFLHSGLSADMLGSFTFPYGGLTKAITYHNGSFISVDYQGDIIHVFSGLGVSNELGSFPLTQHFNCEGITIDGSGNLIAGDSNGHIYQYDGISQTVNGSFFIGSGPAPDYFDRLADGLAFYDGNLYSIQESEVKRAYKHSGVSNTYLGSVEVNANTQGIAFSGANMLTSVGGAHDHIFIHSGFSDVVTGSFAAGRFFPYDIFTLNLERSTVYQFEDTDSITLTDDFTSTYTHIPQTISITKNEEITFTDNFNITYTHIPTTYSKTLSEELNLTDNFTSFTLSKTYSKTLSEEINLIDDFTSTYINIPSTFSSTLSDDFTLTDNFTSTRELAGQFSPTATYNIKTKVEIDGTEYKDYRNLKVTKSMSDYSASSSFSLTLDSPFGRHKNSFNVGDEIIIYADDTTGTPTTKLLTGIIEKIKFRGYGTSQEVTLTGRDYSARLLDATIEPSVYTNSEVSTIVSNIMQNFVDDVTTNNVNVTTTTLSRINFRHTSVYDALDELAELSNFIWYVDTDKDLHFEEKDSVSSNYYLDENVIISTNYEQTREGMVNDVWVYGDKYLAGFQETIDTDGGSAITLINKPHNTYLEYLGSPYKGGIYQLTKEPVSGTDYEVNYHDREIFFNSGTEIGYNSIPASGGSVLVRYDREIPIIRHKRNVPSINTYGKKTKVIQDDSIKDPTSADDVANKEIEKNSPFKGLEIEVRGWLDLTPGNTIQVSLNDFNISETVGIISVDYIFDANRVNENRIIKIKVDKKILDITDEIKNLSKKVKKLESRNLVEQQTITTYKEFVGSTLVSGVYWEINTRTIGSSFILGHPVNGILGSPAPSQDGGSQVVLGDSRSAFTTAISGGGI